MDALVTALRGAVVDFSLITIFDIIDIAIIAFLVYKVMVLIRTTNSGKVARGILLIMVAVWLSGVFNLYTVNFLLSRLLEWGVVAIVVLFQPELRKFLEQVGSSKLGHVFSTHQTIPDEMDNAITQTVKAYASLSESKTGALMVFERDNMLNDAIRTGTALDKIGRASCRERVCLSV